MSFEIALTGINAASTDLDVIANNIANANTTAFKRSRVDFADVYAQNTLGASGRGVSVANVKQEFDQGDLSGTSSNLDLGVEGQGMFRLSNDGTDVYTRAGNFGLDKEGFITNNEDMNLVGYSADDEGRVLPILGNLQVQFEDIQPKQTALLEVSMNLDAADEVPPAFDVADPDTYNFSAPTTVYDSLGASQTATSYFHKNAPNTWSHYLYLDGVEVSQPGGDELVFTPEGALDTVNGAPGTTTVQTTVFNPLSGAAPMDMTIDIGSISQYHSAYGVNQIIQDGYATGRLDDIEINARGQLFGRFTNGQNKLMGQVVLANFTNTQGLSAAGGTSWSETPSSGPATVGAPQTASLGSIQSGNLEQSNVNLTEELVDMIGAQRAFQANAQVISTSDQVTQTIMNIRR